MSELRLHIPRSWSEISEDHLIAISEMLMMVRNKYDLLVPALMIFSGIRHYQGEKIEGARWFTHKSVEHPFILDNDQLALMANKLEYLTEISECRPIMWIRGTRARHHRMYNACFEEYLMAENYFFAYNKTKQVQYLEQLMAILYRYPWQRWNSNLIEKRSHKFRKVSDGKKYAALVWYIGFRSYVQKRCKNLFSGSSGSTQNIRDYINGVIHTLNNGDITITDRMLRQPCWYALDELEQRARIAVEEAEKLESMKKRR